MMWSWLLMHRTYCRNAAELAGQPHGDAPTRRSFEQFDRDDAAFDGQPAECDSSVDVR